MPVYASSAASSGGGIQINPPPPSAEDNSVSLNLTMVFSNHTNATLQRQAITEEQGNMLVSIINGIVAGKKLNDLENLELEELPEQEEEQQQQDDNQGSSGGDNGGDGGGGYDPNADVELMPPEGPGLNPEPEPSEEGGNGSGGSSSDDEGSESES